MVVSFRRDEGRRQRSQQDPYLCEESVTAAIAPRVVRTQEFASAGGNAGQL